MRLKELNDPVLETKIEAIAVRYRVKCDSMNMIIIKQTLLGEYSSYLVEDFDNAFIKHCSGKFMIDKEQSNNKPYGDLSTLFICSVLNHYKEYKNKQNLIKPLEAPKTNMIEEKKKSKEENAEEWYNFINDEFEKNGKVPLMADWNAAYWWMVTNKIIEVDKDTLEMFAENVRADIEHDIKVRKAERRDFKLEQKILDHPKSFKIECRKRYLINYYENKA